MGVLHRHDTCTQVDSGEAENPPGSWGQLLWPVPATQELDPFFFLGGPSANYFWPCVPRDDDSPAETWAPLWEAGRREQVASLCFGKGNCLFLGSAVLCFQPRNSFPVVGPCRRAKPHQHSAQARLFAVFCLKRRQTALGKRGLLLISPPSELPPLEMRFFRELRKAWLGGP